MSGKIYEAPHYTVFYSLLLFKSKQSTRRPLSKYPEAMFFFSRERLSFTS
jgi:hypothetical protein